MGELNTSASGAFAPPSGENPGLSAQELAILEFERQWWRYPGSKEGAIRELFSMSSPRYYQLLNALLDRAEAELAYPTLVRRLRRLRNSRTTGSGSNFQSSR